jgi:hypothetical protein
MNKQHQPPLTMNKQHQPPLTMNTPQQLILKKELLVSLLQEHPVS